MAKTLRAWAIPLGLLALLIISFGLLIPWLGFYWDDWSVLITHHMRGIQGFWEYYQYDRPVSAWTLYVVMPFLGVSPVRWHIFTLLLRWGTTLALWWTWTGLWPKQRTTATLAAFLFAVYPIFEQQAIAVAYSQHWTCYLLYAISLGLMVWAWRKPRRAALLTALGLALAVLQMFTMEYFIGLELLRPMLLWILAAEEPISFSKKLRQVFWRWLPYLIGLAVSVIWRLFLLKLPVEDPNTPTLLYQFFSAPLQTVLHLVELAVQDLAFMLVSVWGNLFQAGNLTLNDSFTLFSWGVGLLAAVGLFFFLLRQPATQAATTAPAAADTAQPRAARQAMLIGAAGILFGVLPIWLTNRQVMSGLYSDRFGLPAMLGASLLVVGLVQWLVNSHRKQLLLIALLVGLSVSQQLRVDNEFRWGWVKQTRFYWQLSWRAPMLQPQTALFSDGEFFAYMGGNATTAAIDILYPTTPGYELPYYFYSLGRDFSYQMPEFLNGMEIHEKNYRIFHFTSSTKNALIVDYDPTRNDCLHVLSPEDASVPDLPAVTVQALPNANLALIQPGPAASGYPPTDLYGPEPDLEWCKLFQQADLARQQQDWSTVVQLGDEAVQKGYSLQNASSNTPYEWLPFVEGYALSGDMTNARQLTQAILDKDPRYQTRLCTSWNKINRSASDSAQQQASAAMLLELQCAP